MWPAYHGSHVRSSKADANREYNSLNVRLDPVPQIRLPIGLVDVGFLTKKSLVSVTL